MQCLLLHIFSLEQSTSICGDGALGGGDPFGLVASAKEEGGEGVDHEIGEVRRETAELGAGGDTP